MRPVRFALYAASGFVALAAIATLSAPKLRAAIRATLVEVVIPSRPYNVTPTFDSLAFKVFGPDSGALGVTTITLANFSPATETMSLFQAGVINGDCTSGTVVSLNQPAMNFILQPNTTLVIPYASPLVFTGIGGHTCIYAQVTPDPGAGHRIEMGVTGFVN
jgi:hypothetical protein